MGHQIIKQPDGKFAVFSSVVDAFILEDATPEDIIQMELAEKEETIRHTVTRTIEQLEAGKKPHFQFTMSYEEAKRQHIKTKKANGRSNQLSR